MDRLIAVTDRVSFSDERTQHLGVLEQLRGVVTAAREHYPEIADGTLYDVGLSRRGREVEVTLYFQL